MTKARNVADQINRVNSSAANATAITIDANENVNFSANATFGDNDKAIFGAGSDLQIYHDSSASYIKEVGVGPLNIQMEATSGSISSGAALLNFLAKTGPSLHTAANLSIHQPGNGEGIGDFRFSVGDGAGVLTEAMRISSGNLLVGQSSSTAVGAGNTTTGFSIRGDGGLYASRSSGPTITANANAFGDIIKLYKSGSNVGRIGSFSTTVVYLAGISNGLKIVAPAAGVDAFGPSTTIGGNRDNTMDIGWSSNRFDDIYATNGTIQTSDRNEKQDIEVLTSAETAVAVACKGLLRKFRWIDSVTEKGDDARIHFGIIAQDLQDAFTAEGLDAGRYAMFISTTWWETQTDVPAVEAVAEVLDEDGNVVTEAVEATDAYTRTDTFDALAEAPEGATERTRLGVRYPELLAFIIGAM